MRMDIQALTLRFMEQPQQRRILQMTVMGMQPVQQAVHRQAASQLLPATSVVQQI